MQLTAEVRESLNTGKFEEFVDRAEDYLKELYFDALPRVQDASDEAWREIVRDSYRIAQQLNRPSERLTVVIAKARIPLGFGAFTEARFAHLSRAITAFSCNPGPSDDPVTPFLEQAESFWKEDRWLAGETQFHSLFKEFEASRNTDALVEYLSSEERSHGHYNIDDIRHQISINLKSAKKAGLVVDTDLFRYMVLSDCYGSWFDRDPFYPSFKGAFASIDAKNKTLNAVAEETPKTIKTGAV